LDKPQRKALNKKLRQQQQQQKQRRMRILIWATVILFAAIVAVAFILKPEPKPITIDYGKVPTVGSENAPVKIVEFGDFKCPACRIFSQNIYPQLKADFIDTGKASFSYLNYTIISPNGDSVTAAVAAQAVYHQNKDAFWTYYKTLFDHQGDEHTVWATPDYLVQLAKQADLGIDYDKLSRDIVNNTYKDEVDKQTRLARDNGFYSTPTILINGKKLDDNASLNYGKLKAEIEKALKAQENGK